MCKNKHGGGGGLLLAEDVVCVVPQQRTGFAVDVVTSRKPLRPTCVGRHRIMPKKRESKEEGVSEADAAEGTDAQVRHPPHICTIW